MRAIITGTVSAFALLVALGAAAACSGGSPNADGNGDDGGDANALVNPGDDGSHPTPESGPGAPDTAPTPSPFGLDTRPPNPTCLAPARPPSGVAVAFKQVFATVSLASPMMIRQPPADPTRMFVAERGGTIVSIPVAKPPTGAATSVFTTPITPNVNGEGGLLGFAFHPSFATNGLMYISYTPTDATVAGSNMRSVIARIKSTDGGATFGGYTEIFKFNQTTATNHKGGAIAFGPDGYLYFGFGDGGGGGDTFINGQNKATELGKIHRIDVDTTPPAGQSYVIPDGNPFKGGGGFPSIYAYGIRNPFRFTFDRGSGDLWLGDVGQNLWEEIDRIQAPGANLGWPCREGANPYAPNDAARCPNPKAGFLEPVFEYPHDNGASKAVIGGVVYRGKAVPAMVGTYIFGDEVNGSVWALQYSATGVATSVQLNAQGPNGNWTQFAEDDDGELYLVDLSGKIYEMVAAPPPADAGAPAPPFPDMLSKTGCVDPQNPQHPASGLIPYDVNSPLWSDGAEKGRWLAIPDGKTITVGADGHLDPPIGSVLMKTFSVGGKRIETRLLVRHADGGWAGYTYEWDDAETDATLLPSSKSKAVGAQTWYYPSRSDCFNCHSGAAGRTLGMLLGQLNGDYVYSSTNRVSNQLATLDHIGMFDAPLATPVAQIEAFPSPTGGAALDQRARSYLQTNCAICHRPNGNGGGPMDFRYETPLGNASACNVAPDNGDLGVTGAKILVPGSPAKSLLSLRPHALDAKRMPPLATHVVDTAGVAVIDSWIQSLTTCPPPVVVDAGVKDAADQ